MLPIEYYDVFKSYLLSLDRHVGYDVDRTKGVIGEESSTNTLVTSVDPLVDPPAGLAVTARAFVEEMSCIEVDGVSPGQVSFSFETFSKAFEGALTHSDFALTLKFTDTSENTEDKRSFSWEAVYYLQAKITRAIVNGQRLVDRTWTETAKFGKTAGQDEAIRALRREIKDRLQYALYCPLQVATRFKNSSLVNRFTDETKEISENSSIWFNGERPNRIANLLEMGETASPFSQFILDHYFAGAQAGQPCGVTPCRGSQHQEAELARKNETLRGVLEGNVASMEEWAGWLNEQDFEARNFVNRVRNIYPITLDVHFPTYDYEQYMARKRDINDLGFF